MSYQDSMQFLEKCKGCDCELEYDVTTTYDNELKTHVCNECGRPVEQ